MTAIRNREGDGKVGGGGGGGGRAHTHKKTRYYRKKFIK